MTDSARIDLIYSLFSCDTIEPSAPMSLFFAASFIAQFGETPSPVLTIPELCKTLALPIGQSRKAIADLIQMGLLSREKQNWVSQPSYIFQMNLSSLRSQFPPRNRSTRCQATRALQLLEWGSEKPQDRTHQLRIPLRTLLLILLAHASATGTVEGLGHSQLAKRTGQTQRQIKNHLKHLVRYGYIYQVVQGGSFRAVLGRRTNVYLLNMRHPSYSEAVGGGFTGIFTLPIVDDLRLERREASQHRWIVAKLASAALNAYGQDLVPDKPYLPTCPDNNRIPEACILDTLDRSDGLLPAPNQVDQDDPPSNVFIQQVKNVCSNPFTSNLKEIPLDAETNRETLKLLLTACAIHRAMQAAVSLRGIPDIEVQDYRYLILPQHLTSKTDHLLTIEAFPIHCDGTEHTVYNGEVVARDHRNDWIVLAKPKKMSDQQRLCSAGLRTLPFEKPTLKRSPG